MKALNKSTSILLLLDSSPIPPTTLISNRIYITFNPRIKFFFCLKLKISSTELIEFSFLEKIHKRFRDRFRIYFCPPLTPKEPKDAMSEAASAILRTILPDIYVYIMS